MNFSWKNNSKNNSEPVIFIPEEESLSERIRKLPLKKQIRILISYLYYNYSCPNLIDLDEAIKIFARQHPEINLYKEYKKIERKRQQRLKKKDINVDNTNSLTSFTFTSENECEY